MTKVHVNPQDNASSSDDEEEDEEAKELTEDVEKSFFKTLSCLKKNDPKIYDESIKFFDSSTRQITNTSTDVDIKCSNPIYLEEYKRNILLEHGPEFDDTVETNDVLKKEKVRISSPTYVEEQKAIKESFKGALEDNSDDEDILKPRTKTKEEQEKEEKDYLEWLKGNIDELEDKETKNDLQHLHDYWNNPNLDEGEQFLCDYILNKRFLEKPIEENLIEDEMKFSDEDEMLEKHEEFEHKYNFRFEEPDKDFIKTYPRTMENSLRRKEEKRKKKREELNERKKNELEKRSLEIKQLKKLKKKEIVDRIRKLEELTGNKGVGFEDTELEADFNPTEYDRKMQELFDEEFYDKTDYAKPVFDEEEDEFIMDCDYDPSMDKRAKKQTRAAKRKEKKKLIVNEEENDEEINNKKIPKYNPVMGSFEKYIDEYYSLDCEDVVSGVPTRYTYNKVLPNDYGLTIEEILLADDNELNKWYPLGKLTKLQPEAVQKFESKIYKRKGKDIELKKKMLPSLFKEEFNEPDEITDKKKETNTTKKKKNKKSLKNMFKVENLPNNSNELQHGNGNKIIKNKKNYVKDNTQNKFIKTDKKLENQKIDHILKKNISNVKKVKKQNIDVIQNKNKNVKKQNMDATQDTNKIINNVKKGEKQNINVTQNKNKMINNVKKQNIDATQDKNKIINKVKKQNINVTQDTNKIINNVKKGEKQNIDVTQNKNKIINNVKKQNIDATQDKNKIINNVKKGKKRKIDNVQNGLNKKHKFSGKKHKTNNKEVSALETMTDDRLKAYGINPKKFKNKLKYGNN